MTASRMWIVKLAAGIAATLPLQAAAGGSMYMATLCKGHHCTEASHPILDYDKEDDKCICRAHPCWEDKGVAHECPDKKFSHLMFSFSVNRTLTCSCHEKPQYATLYINRELCPGHICENEQFPVLDYDPAESKCICRAHPCDDLDGNKHECSDPKFPILRYRIEETDGVAKPVCECAAKLLPPKNDEL